jgi:hypothetical protein
MHASYNYFGIICTNNLEDINIFIKKPLIRLHNKILKNRKAIKVIRIINLVEEGKAQHVLGDCMKFKVCTRLRLT